MHLLYCGDRNVCTGIRLSALSVCQYETAPVHISLLTAAVDGSQPIPATFAENLQKELSAGGIAHQVELFDITQHFLDQPPTANMATRFTPCCMLRLYADLIPEIPDKVIYLDADVLCRDSLSPLFSVDMEGAEIAGVPDRYGKWFFGDPLRHNYLNSGVLLLDMKAIRRSGLFRKCRTLCQRKRMFMPDQSALNKLAKKKKLPRRYNEQAAICEDTVCKHFTTFFRFLPYFHPVTVKPWDKEKLHNVLHIYEFDHLLDKEQTQ